MRDRSAPLLPHRRKFRNVLLDGASGEIATPVLAVLALAVVVKLSIAGSYVLSNNHNDFNSRFVSA